MWSKLIPIRNTREEHENTVYAQFMKKLWSQAFVWIFMEYSQKHSGLLTGLHSWSISDTCQNDKAVYRHRRGINGVLIWAEYKIYYLTRFDPDRGMGEIKKKKVFQLLTLKMSWNVVTV